MRTVLRGSEKPAIQGEQEAKSWRAAKQTQKALPPVILDTRSSTVPFPAFLTQLGSGGLLGARTGRPRWLHLADRKS